MIKLARQTNKKKYKLLYIYYCYNKQLNLHILFKNISMITNI